VGSKGQNIKMGLALKSSGKIGTDGKLLREAES